MAHGLHGSLPTKSVTISRLNTASAGHADVSAEPDQHEMQTRPHPFIVSPMTHWTIEPSHPGWPIRLLVMDAPTSGEPTAGKSSTLTHHW